MKNLVLAAVAATTFAAPAIAGEYNWNGFYVGGDLATDDNFDDAITGVHVGHRFDFVNNDVILGLEGGLAYNNDSEVTTYNVEGHVGVEIGRTLPYVGVGYVIDENDNDGEIYVAGVTHTLDNSWTIGVKYTHAPDFEDKVGASLGFNF